MLVLLSQYKKYLRPLARVLCLLNRISQQVVKPADKFLFCIMFQFVGMLVKLVFAEELAGSLPTNLTSLPVG